MITNPKYKFKDASYTPEQVVETFNRFKKARAPYDRKWDIISDFHAGNIWKVLRKPKYQISNDTNYLEYVSSSIKNSMYTGNFIATVLPRSHTNQEVAKNLNKFLEIVWDITGFKEFTPLLGEDTILYNVGYIRRDWDTSVIDGANKKEQGQVKLSYLETKQVYLDPLVTEYEKGQAVFIIKQVNINDLARDSNLAEGAKDYIKLKKEEGKGYPIDANAPDYIKNNYDPASGSVTLLEAYYKHEKGIDQIFILNSEFVILHKENIKPDKFPIIPMYGTKPKKGPYGESLASKIITNIAAYNIITSLELTHIYRSQNRNKLVSTSAGINIAAFAQQGNDPDKAWMVAGDPNQVIKYVDLPELPNNITITKSKIEQDIMLVTGVDLRYTGRDTGSIQTTGGTDLAQSRIIGQTDNARILALEVFIEEITKDIVDTYKELGGTYSVVARNIIKTETVDSSQEINFKEIKNFVFDYSLGAGPYLPKNALRLADAANKLMEMQGQYQFNPPIITHTEWLKFQDFPQKDLILARMEADMAKDDSQEIINILQNFAGLLERGIEPQEAIQLMVDEKQFLRQNPDVDKMTK